ncbi:phosphonate C-P lyase system protein PhnG [Roseibium limicola]
MDPHSESAKMASGPKPTPPSTPKTARQQAMALLASADPAQLTEMVDALPVSTAHEIVRPAETGLVMARGRMGGTGSPFNLGEVTVTRCVVRLSSGEVGSAYTLGRNKQHTRNAALCDALWQHPAHTVVIDSMIITPLAEMRDAARHLVKAETAATKVDFFTMVRGDD